jgi:hypothetical protein
MFDCHFCGKSFGDKAGLTQHCKGKKHSENMDASEKRKEPDPLETATRAAKIAMEAEALQQFQQGVQAARAAQNTSEAASKTAARLQGQKLSSDKAASLKKKRAAQDAHEAEDLVQRQKLLYNAASAIEAARVAQDADKAAQREKASTDDTESKVTEAAFLVEYRDSVSETRASSLATPVRGGFAEEVKSPKFYEPYLALIIIIWPMTFQALSVLSKMTGSDIDSNFHLLWQYANG